MYYKICNVYHQSLRHSFYFKKNFASHENNLLGGDILSNQFVSCNSELYQWRWRLVIYCYLKNRRKERVRYCVQSYNLKIVWHSFAVVASELFLHKKNFTGLDPESFHFLLRLVTTFLEKTWFFFFHLCLLIWLQWSSRPNLSHKLYCSFQFIIL